MDDQNQPGKATPKRRKSLSAEGQTYLAQKEKVTASKRKKAVTFEDDAFLFDGGVEGGEQRTLGIKNEYMVLYIAAAIVGLMVVFVGALGAFNLFSGMGGGNTNPLVVNQSVTPPTNELPALAFEPPQEAVSDNLITVTAMITGLDMNNRMVSLHNMETRENYNTFVTTGTDLRGRFNQLLIFSELRMGDMVQLSYNPDNNHAMHLRQLDGDHIWEHRFVTGVNVDYGSRTLVYDGRMYTFNTETLVLNQGNPYSLGNIGPLSMVTLRGMGNTVWFVEVERGYGTVQFLNNLAVINGFVQIGLEATVELGAEVSPLDQIVQLSEGPHTLIIDGDNIARDLRDIEVMGGQTIQVDLSDLAIIGGGLNIQVTPAEATVSVNGATVDVSEPLLMQFGALRVVAQHPGYQPFDEVIAFESHNQQLPIVLMIQPYSPTLPGGFTPMEPSAPTTRVEFRSVPTGATVFVDGQYLGQTPLITQVAHGQRHITLQLEGFQTTQDTRIITMGPMIPFEYEMQPLPSLPQPGVPGAMVPPSEPPTAVTPPPVVSPPVVTPPVVTPPNQTPVMPDAPHAGVNPFPQQPSAPGYFNNAPGYTPPVGDDELTTIPNP